MSSKDILNKYFKGYLISSYDDLNSDYEGLNITFSNQSFKVRTGKRTPKKEGYFTVVWIKDADNKNIPYSYEMFEDYLIVIIKEEHGLFIFPKDVLRDKRILYSKSTKGKMGFRVYTSDDNLNVTASKTYHWMKDYYVRSLEDFNKIMK